MVTSIYDNASCCATMTVAGQAQVTDTYDNANRLRQVQQETATTPCAGLNAAEKFAQGRRVR